MKNGEGCGGVERRCAKMRGYLRSYCIACALVPPFPFHALIVATFPLPVSLLLPPNTLPTPAPACNQWFVPSYSNSTLLSLGLSVRPHSSSISEAFSYLWFPHLCGRWLSRCPSWLAPSRTVVLILSSLVPRGRLSVTHTYFSCPI